MFAWQDCVPMKHRYGHNSLIFTEYATVGYMAKRIQMRKQRFVAIQKIASEKKMPVDCPPVGDPHTLSKMGTLSRCPPGRPSVCSYLDFTLYFLACLRFETFFRVHFRRCGSKSMIQKLIQKVAP